MLVLQACGTMMAPSLWARRAWSLCKEDDHAAQDTGTVMYVHIRRYKRNMLTSVQSRSVCRIHGPLPSHSRQATIVPTAGMAHGGPGRLGPYWYGCGWHCSPGGLAPAPHVTLPSPVHTVPSWWAHGQRGLEPRGSRERSREPGTAQGASVCQAGAPWSRLVFRSNTEPLSSPGSGSPPPEIRTSSHSACPARAPTEFLMALGFRCPYF